jgi:hypothetical protein
LSRNRSKSKHSPTSGPKKANRKSAGAVANEKDEQDQGYQPPAWAWNLVRAFLDPELKPTIEARCKSAGIHKTTFYDQIQRSEFKQWFYAQLDRAVAAEGAQIRLALLRRCLQEDNKQLDAIRLWADLFGLPKAAPPPARVSDRVNGLVADLLNDTPGADSPSRAEDLGGGERN